jgi:hypothetical protein
MFWQAAVELALHDFPLIRMQLCLSWRPMRFTQFFERKQSGRVSVFGFANALALSSTANAMAIVAVRLSMSNTPLWFGTRIRTPWTGAVPR